MSRALRRATAALSLGLLAALTLPVTSPAGAAPSRRGIGLSLRSQPAWASTGDDVPFGLSLRGELTGLELRAVIHTYITTRAGFELGTGVLINVVPPEQAAAQLQGALVQ